MKHWTNLLFSLLIGSLLGIIKCEGTLSEIKEQYPNRFAAGLNLSHLDLNIHMASVKAKGNNAFSGIHIGYEYRKPESLYMLLDIGVSGSDHRLSVNAKEVDHNRSLNLRFGKIALLFGYTNTYCNWLWTPYVGFNSFLVRNENTHQAKLYERLRGFAIGIRADYSFNDCFDLGTDIQLFNICGIKEYRLKNFNNSYLARSYFESYGLNISLPMTYHYGQTRQWDIKIEPYYTVIAFRHNQHTYGANFLVGYNF